VKKTGKNARKRKHANAMKKKEKNVIALAKESVTITATANVIATVIRSKLRLPRNDVNPDEIDISPTMRRCVS